MNAVEVRNLSKSYPGFELKNIKFALPEGCIMGLVGENGAGKSTLIRLIMGAARRDSGQINVLGTDNLSPEFTKVKDSIGVVLDEPHFPRMLNARQIGSVMASTYSGWNADVYAGFLRDLGLPEKKRVADYSRGMTMKLALAAALSHEARLLVLDEPTGGLDPMVRDEILDILEDYTRSDDRSVLISSHIVSDLEKLCDYIAFLHRGELLLFDSKDSIMDNYGVARLDEERFRDLPDEAVLGTRRGKYGIEALVERRLVNPAIPVDRASLEEIIVLFAKGERK